MLNLKALENRRIDILKAEVGALLFNMGKTHAGFGPWKSYIERNFPGTTVDRKFGNYSAYYAENPAIFFNELKEVSDRLEQFFRCLNAVLPSRDSGFQQIPLIEIMKASRSMTDLSRKILFRGCENVNSGIDKGTPLKQMNKIFLANAFGKCIKELSTDDLDDRRKSFWTDLDNFMGNDYDDPDWEVIRNWFIENIKTWYSSILSDSRLQANDVTLWDQVYMVASMFKAVLADMCLISSDDRGREKIGRYFDLPSDIKWRILGVQYDKLGLAERGFRPAQIKWYRDAANRIDESIKKLIEVRYALGNEIYRDETGIYFLVGEDLAGDDQNYLAELHPDLREVKEKILDIFKKKLYQPGNESCRENEKEEALEHGEFFPSLFLTKPSRGMMNLIFLLREAMSNFLRPDYPKDSFYLDGKGMSYICPVCRRRAFSASDRKNRYAEDIPVCNVCYNRANNRLADWIKSPDKETIWTTELQDRNGRIALVSLKFDLNEWLNGNMLNSFLTNEADYKKLLDETKMFFRTFFTREPVLAEDYNWLCELADEISYLDAEAGKKCKNLKLTVIELKNLVEYLRSLAFTEIKLGERIKGNAFRNASSLQAKMNIAAESYPENSKERRNYNEGYFDAIIKFIYDHLLEELSNSERDLQIVIAPNKGLIKRENYEKYVSSLDRLIAETDNLKKGSFSIIDYSKEAFSGCKIHGESFDDWIRQVFFGSIMGNEWEAFVRNSSLGKVIDWDARKILWKDWTRDDIDLFSALLLQFILRKNPSPARLRRIWETTKGFFIDMEKRITELAGMEDTRCRRLVWDDPLYNGAGLACGENENCKRNGDIAWNDKVHFREYCDGELLFIAAEGKIYMISPAPQGKDEFVLKPYDDPTSGESIMLLRRDAVVQPYEPYFSIIDPTPVSWQFIIPAEYVPNLIRSISSLYMENFRFAYGKLRLHTGIVIQNYRKPLYVGIKALRKIRHDNVEKEHLQKEISARYLKQVLDRQGIVPDITGFSPGVPEDLTDSHAALPGRPEALSTEDSEGADRYYLLYEMADEAEGLDTHAGTCAGLYTGACAGLGTDASLAESAADYYDFFLSPENSSPRRLRFLYATGDDEKLLYYPNTFDFEFMDTNTRRNDIFYRHGRRVPPLKRNRPYTMEDAQLILDFGQFITGGEQASDKITASQFHNFISMLYDKYERWEIGNDERNAESFRLFLVSLIRNTFGKIVAKNAGFRDKLFSMLKISGFEDLKSKNTDETRWIAVLFFDIFEFWHKALKQL